MRKEVSGDILATCRHLLDMGITNIDFVDATVFLEFMKTLCEAKTKSHCFENIPRFRVDTTLFKPVFGIYAILCVFNLSVSPLLVSNRVYEWNQLLGPTD